MEPQFDIKSIKAIIGLGNPGQKYSHNRHSIGFRLIDAIADRFGAPWQTNDTMSYVTIHMPLDATQQELILIKPMTFMNNSGKVVPWLQKKGIEPNQILVMHDELEKPFGSCFIRFGGSHKGLNGLKSIIGVMGADFWRLKFGIGRPVDKDAVPDYVLSNFPRDEEAQIPALIDQALAFIIK
jgi:peptidyl-tRNA hydrolase, PTH1 family